MDVDADDLRKFTQNANANEIVKQEKVSFPTSSENINEIEERISQYLEKIDGGPFRCTICGKEGSRSRNVKNHIETHMEGLSFPCKTCGKTFRSRVGLYNHAGLMHKEEPPKPLTKAKISKL